MVSLADVTKQGCFTVIPNSSGYKTAYTNSLKMVHNKLNLCTYTQRNSIQIGRAHV